MEKAKHLLSQPTLKGRVGHETELERMGYRQKTFCSVVSIQVIKGPDVANVIICYFSCLECGCDGWMCSNHLAIVEQQGDVLR